MSGPPEVRSVLGPAGNTRPRSAFEPVRKLKKSLSPAPAVAPEKESSTPSPKKKAAGNGSAAATLLRREGSLFSNLSMNASCSSDASTDSSQSRASTGGRGRAMGRGRGSRRSLTPSTPVRRKQQQQQCGMRNESVGAEEFAVAKKRCPWVTPNTDPSYAAFHDEEWGVPVYDDKKLFELLSLSTALAELSWPIILNKRQTFREVFQDFDPVAVSKLNDKKIAAPGSPGSSLLSEIKLRAIVENARQTCKIIEEFGSFENYVWGFINHKPTVGHFRYQRQVPIKTSKADSISKDLVKRGFRGIGPTVVYSFMQVAGLTNDHVTSCFRFQESVAMVEARDKPDILIIDANEANQHNDTLELGLEPFSLSG